ncbi:response regulator [Streptomyces acidicola]|uniref:response regulator n=1 Tax=Streptomyces acidicola TaxID=2596892 RepID=UPI0037F29252
MLDLIAHRIVQEALANVTIDYHPHQVRLRVDDEGQHWATAAPPGHGTIGKREHAALCGDRATAQARPRQGLDRRSGAAPAREDHVTVSILLADDQDMVRTSMRIMIDVEPDLEVVGEAADGRRAVELAARLRPDVVVMDIQMPHMDGVDATRQITNRSDAPAVLALTTFDLDEYLFGVLRSGAAGFVLKHDPATTLLEGIRAVARGEGFVSSGPTRRLITQVTKDPSEPAALPDGLTPREHDVLTLLGHAMSNTQIARRLHIEESTVKTHVQSVLTKLEVRTRVQAALIASRAGLIDNPGPTSKTKTH